MQNNGGCPHSIDSTIFGAPAGLVIGGAGLVVLGIGGLVHYFSKSDTDSSKGDKNKPTIQPAPKPEDIKGKTPEEIGEIKGTATINLKKMWYNITYAT